MTPELREELREYARKLAANLPPLTDEQAWKAALILAEYDDDGNKR